MNPLFELSWLFEAGSVITVEGNLLLGGSKPWTVLLQLRDGFWVQKSPWATARVVKRVDTNFMLAQGMGKFINKG